MNEVQHDLKRQIKKSGLTFRDIATQLGLRYVTFNNMLNGFSTLPDEYRRRTLEIISDRQKQTANEIE
jgi:hypothetical protein